MIIKQFDNKINNKINKDKDKAKDKAKKYRLRIGSIILECYKSKYRKYLILSSSNIIKISDNLSKHSVKLYYGKNSLKELPNYYGRQKVESGQVIDCVHIKDAIPVWVKSAMTGCLKTFYFLSDLRDNPFALQQLGITQDDIPLLLKPVKTIPKRDSEKKLQSKLHKLLGGIKESVTEAGSIDLLTSSYVIEIKNTRYWKNALGQLHTYGFYHQDKQKLLVLFGKIDSDKLKLIRKHCLFQGVKVTHESLILFDNFNFF